MKFIVTSILFLSNLLNASAQNNEFGLEGGYGSTGTYFSFHLNVCKLLNFTERKFSTEIFASASGKPFEFNYPPPTFGFTGFEMINLNYPGTVILNNYLFGLEEKFLIDKRHFVSCIAGLGRYALQMDDVLQHGIASYGVYRGYWVFDDIGGETTYTKLGPTVYTGNVSVWNFVGGIGAGEFFGKHFQANARLCFTPAEFDSETTLFGKYFGAEPYENIYKIKLTVFAQIGVQYAFNVIRTKKSLHD